MTAAIDILASLERDTAALLNACATNLQRLAAIEATIRQKTFLTPAHKVRTPRRSNTRKLNP